jgi:hypothetical protein
VDPTVGGDLTAVCRGGWTCCRRGPGQWMYIFDKFQNGCINLQIEIKIIKKFDSYLMGFNGLLSPSSYPTFGSQIEAPNIFKRKTSF